MAHVVLKQEKRGGFLLDSNHFKQLKRTKQKYDSVQFALSDCFKWGVKSLTFSPTPQWG